MKSLCKLKIHYWGTKKYVPLSNSIIITALIFKKECKYCPAFKYIREGQRRNTKWIYDMLLGRLGH